MIVYKITNNFNGKIYIGQTAQSLHKRWIQHCCKSNRCCALHNAILKYGKENFTVEQIDVACDRDELNAKEIYWIEFYDSIVPNGYNLQTGGKYRVLSEESRQKIRDKIKGRKLSEEHKRKIGLASKGRKASKETCLKISLSKTGKKRPPFSEEWLRKLGDASRGHKCPEHVKIALSVAKKGVPRPKEVTERMRQTKIRNGVHKGEKNWFYGKVGALHPVAVSVRNITLNKVFGSARDAARFCGRIECSSIVKCCKGKRKRAFGYEWEYVK